MTAPTLVAFDLDDTLAPSKGLIDPRIAALLRALLRTVDVAIISGGNEAQFRSQVVSRLGECAINRLTRLGILAFETDDTVDDTVRQLVTFDGLFVSEAVA